jgi:glycosyltransferase involved in cell wall biosynthesis
MRILVIHNRYSSRVPSGENLAVDDEIRWLEEAGVEVHRLEASNDDVVGGGAARKAKAAASVIWSPAARQRTAEAVDRTRPDVIHIHNLFPLLSSSVLSAARQRGVPVLWTVHNRRVTCVGGDNFRRDAACHACRPGWRVPGIVHGCFSDSRAASALNTGATAVFRPMARRSVIPLAISQHVKDWLIGSAGFDADQVHVKYNGVAPPPADRRLVPAAECTDLVFAARLTPPKGARLLIEAWRIAVQRLPEDSPVTLTVIGEGVLAEDVQELAAADRRVRYTGLLDGNDVGERMARARAVVVPSVWDEPFGRVAAEGLAHSRPIVSTGTGGLAEVVDGEVGWTTGVDPGTLADALVDAATDDDGVARRAAAAGKRYEARFSPGATTAALISRYETAVPQ